MDSGWTIYYDTGTSAWTTANTFLVSGNYPGGTYWAPTIAAPEPQPESALEWLDRRVDEMRVAL